LKGLQLNNKSATGFTLIELLVVMAILLLLLGSAALSVQTLGSHWRKSAEKQQHLLKEYKSLDVVSSALHSIVPLEVKDKKEQRGFYFLGRDEGFTAITTSGVLNVGRLSVIRLLKERQADGLFSLYYEEAALNNYPLVYSEQEHNFNFRLLVLENLPELEFSYYGWASYQAYQDFNSEIVQQKNIIWQADFDGMKIRMQPERVSIRLGSASWIIDFAQRTEFLQSRRPEADNV
jgi:prepilin-type N-terminal cleavage/methylation domain-containing protein